MLFFLAFLETVLTKKINMKYSNESKFRLRVSMNCILNQMGIPVAQLADLDPVLQDINRNPCRLKTERDPLSS